MTRSRNPAALIFLGLLSFASAYAGPPLTAAEQRLVKSYRKDAQIAGEQKKIAEAATLRVFGRNVKADESDAFRHYLWASLMVKELGQPMAQKFLDAHEEGSGNPGPEEQMDRHNNALAVNEAAAYRKANPKPRPLADIEAAALKALSEKRLVVLTPLGGPIKH